MPHHRLHAGRRRDACTTSADANPGRLTPCCCDVTPTQRLPAGFQSTSPSPPAAVVFAYRARTKSRSDKPVQVSRRQHAHRRAELGDCRPGVPLRPSHDRADDVQQCGACTAAGQHEARELRQLRVVVVDRLPRAHNVRLQDAQRRRARVRDHRRREIGADVEQVVLHVQQDIRGRRRAARPSASATPRAEFASSQSPNAISRWSAFDVRDPSTSAVVPSSPVLV